MPVLNEYTIDREVSFPPFEPILRRSEHFKKPSTKLRDFHLYHTTKIGPSQSSSSMGTRHLLHRYISYAQLLPKYRKSIFTITTLVEPLTYEQTSLDPKWREAMVVELKALEQIKLGQLRHSHMDIVPSVVNGCTRFKYNSDAIVERYEARLVAKGFTQREGIDYKETFAHVAKLTTVRCLLVVAAVQSWPLHQMNVQNAFLHGDLMEEVYMQMPLGLCRPGEQHLLCRLNKSLYGLKQASRSWFKKFSTAFQHDGFRQSKAEYSLFTKTFGNSFIVVLIYVDDMIITENDDVAIADLKNFLNTKFRIKDLGQLRYFLGIKVARCTSGISISQRKYILDILDKAGLLGSKPLSTPMEENLNFYRQ